MIIVHESYKPGEVDEQIEAVDSFDFLRKGGETIEVDVMTKEHQTP